MMQKLAWKAMNSRCGIVVPSRGVKPTSCRKRVVEAADDRAVPVERERVAHERPRDGRDRERGDAHHERVERVAGAHEARRRTARARASSAAPARSRRASTRCRRCRRSALMHRTGVTASSSVSAGADADDPLERHDEDLAVADLAGPRALAERVDRRLDERVGDGDLEAHLLGEPHLHPRAAVGLDAVELAAVALHAARSRRRAPRRGTALPARRSPSPGARCR